MSIDAKAVRLCDDSIQLHSKSFSTASRFLPPQTRARAVVLYAWCRRADDLVDLVDPARARLALGQLHAELDAIYADRPMHDLALDAFRAIVHGCRIPRSYPDELVAGLAMDARGYRYRTMDDLLQYCYRVAGTVGVMMCHVMGIKDDDALRNAIHLGIAMQMTNIARDVREDFQRGRLYLPESLLRRNGIATLHPGDGRDLTRDEARALRPAIAELLTEADRYYRSGDRGMLALSTQCALAIRTARFVYCAIGHELRRREHDALAGRAIVPKFRKLGWTAVAMAETARELPQRLGQRLRDDSLRARIPARDLEFPGDVLPI